MVEYPQEVLRGNRSGRYLALSGFGPLPLKLEKVYHKITDEEYIVKLPAHRAGFPGHAVASRMRANKISFLFVSLDPAYKAGFAGHVPIKKM